MGASMGTYRRLRRTQEALSSPPSRVLHGPTRLLLLWDENSFGSKHISRLEVKYAAVGESDRRAAHSPPPSSGTDGASRSWQWRPQEVHVTVKERCRARGGGGQGVSRSGGTGGARGEVRVALTGLRPGMVYKIMVRGVSGEGVRGCWSLPAHASSETEQHWHTLCCTVCLQHPRRTQRLFLFCSSTTRSCTTRGIKLFRG